MKQIPLAYPWLLALLMIPAGLVGRAYGGDASDLGAIRRLLEAEEPSARASAVRRLAGRDSRAALDLVADRLADPHPYVRRAAAGVLGTVDEGLRPRVEKTLRRLGDETAQAEACRAFALWADARGRLALLARLEARAPCVRIAALQWLADDEHEDVAAALPARLADRDGAVRALAVDVLAARGAGGIEVEPLLEDPDWRVRLSALEGSVAGAPPLEGGGKAVVAVLHGLDDAVWSVRLLAAELSRRLPDARLLPTLVRTLEDPRRRVAAAAHEALVALTGIPFDPDPETWTRWLATDGLDFDPSHPVGEPGRRPPPPPRGRTVARPRFMGLAIDSGHVAFVLDASGSMGRTLSTGESRWAAACRELDGALGALGSASVNVFVFRDGVEAAHAQPVRLSASKRKTLVQWLATIRPGGRTALFDGIAAALADPETDNLVVLSDGAPSAGRFFTKTDLLAEIRRLNRWRRARIDVIALGSDGIAARWRDVLRRLAEENSGTLIRR